MLRRSLIVFFRLFITTDFNCDNLSQNKARAGYWRLRKKSEFGRERVYLIDRLIPLEELKPVLDALRTHITNAVVNDKTRYFFQRPIKAH